MEPESRSSLTKRSPKYDDLLCLLSPQQKYAKIIEHPTIKNDETEELLSILDSALTAQNCKENVLQLVTKLNHGRFVKDAIPAYLSSVLVNRDVKTQTILVIIHVLASLLHHQPRSSYHTCSCVLGLIYSIIEKSQDQHYDISELTKEYEQLQEQCEDVARQINRRDVMRDTEIDSKRESDMIPPDNYRDISILPKLKELKAIGRPFLRKNMIYGAYKDVDHYLDVQFRLLREDFVGPLRKGLSEMINSTVERHARKFQDIQVYYGVHILEPHCAGVEGVVHHIEFNVSKMKYIQWESTKRLKSGSFICLSHDSFNTAVFGVITDRSVDLLRKGKVTVRFEQTGENRLKYDPYATYKMIESVAYFEAYRHNLIGLQEHNHTTLPFQTYFLNTDVAIEQPPSYLERASVYDFSVLLKPDANSLHDTKHKLLHEPGQTAKVHILDYHDWPAAEKLMLDHSQYKSLQAAITREFAVIQGPPGTGKTFIGLKIVQLLLSNKSVWKRGGVAREINYPLLIVCYTNHALDQFLEGILKTLPGVDLTRVGSRSTSKNALLDRCKIFEKRKIFKNSRHILHDIYTELSECESKIEKKSKCIKLLRQGIIHEQYLQRVMEPHLLASLMSKNRRREASQIVLWLEGIIHDTDISDEDSDEDEKSMIDEDDLEEQSGIMEEDQAMGIDWRRELQQLKTLPELALSKSQMRDRPVQKQNDSEWNVVGSNRIKKKFRKALSEKDVMTEIEMQQLYDVWHLKERDRWRLYRMWVAKYCSDEEQSIHILHEAYNQLAKQLKENREERDYNILRSSDVIGMTTTGAAKNIHILQRLQSRIVIVEEAAEVLEAHIVTTLSRECQHLILIGDHQQLRPNPTSFNLAKHFHLDISLFERMVKNKINCEKLKTQHRMRPEIAQLLVPHIYKVLENHQSVSLYPNIRGIYGNMFFINHTEMEAAIDDSKSHSNVHEAEFCGSLARYLMQQGYSASQITILTAYTGQMFTIKKVLTNKQIRGVLVTPVDNFQGEENDIIILSMVRSNADGKIGFLSIENRICVALSRAKKGFYAIGNISQLENASNLWSDISTSLRKNHQIVDGLPLACQKHSDNKSCIKKAADFDQVPDGGCHLPCEYRLNCGHVCTKKCHPDDPNHDEYQCEKPCPKTLCISGHTCPKFCYEKCGPCHVIVNKVMPVCQHRQDIECSEDPSKVQCRYIVTKTLGCGHTADVKCYENLTKVKCLKPTVRTLPCSHSKEIMCFEDIKIIVCQTEVTHTCKREHVSTLTCAKKHSEYPSAFKCRSLITETLGCGHAATVECHEDLREVRCFQTTVRTLPCGHSGEMKCFEDISKFVCQNQVTHTCTRDHVATFPCAVKTAGIICQVEMENVCLVNGNHKIKIPCCEYSEKFSCKMVCGSALICGHNCSGECGICTERDKHMICQQKCILRLPCGHECTGKCGESCIPCTYPGIRRCSHKTLLSGLCGEIYALCDLPCENRCSHSSCTRRCGQACNRRRCDQSCEKSLSCGHKCYGLCGEPCPPCPICWDDLYKQMETAIDIQIEEDMRFVWLQPCCHVVEVNYMDKLLDIPIYDYPRLMAKCECPICRCRITFCPRYGKQLHDVFVEMQEAKELLVCTYKTNLDIRASVERSGVKNTHDLYIGLIGMEGVEPDTFTKLGIGCIYIILQLQKLKMKADKITTKKSNLDDFTKFTKKDKDFMHKLHDTITH